MRTCDLTLSRAALAATMVLAIAFGAVAQEPAPAADPVAAPVAAPAAGPAGPAKELRDAWDNFLHYILIARGDLAESYGKAVVQAAPDARDVYTLAMESKESGTVLARGRSLENLAPIVDQISKLIDEGAKAVRMDPAEIAKWIKMLGGTLRGYEIAKERLIHSGEYAVPQLIDALEAADSSQMLRERVINVLPSLGKDGVRPLCVVLLNTKEPTVREVVARTLGSVGYPQAAPYLKELAERKGVLDRTKGAALGALAACAGKIAMEKPVAELYYDLAAKYYARADSVSADSRYDTANVWYWKDDLGLSYMVVPRAIFNDVYAMETARMALAHDEAFAPAVELWLAANLRRQADLPEGAKDPTYPADRPTPDYYILAASARFQQGVLKRGLADGDIAVIVGAIGALEKTAGTRNLVAVMADAQGGAQPLVQAVTYPARLVRYMAAETLAKARPDKAFNGSDLVVPVLAEALRQTGSPICVLADPDQQGRNKTKDLLRGGGCVVHDSDSLGKALEEARDSGGVDVFALASNIASPSFAEAHQRIRSEGVFSRTPIIMVARPADMLDARRFAKNDSLLIVLPEDKQTAEGVTEALAEAKTKAAGGTGLSEEQAGEWAIRAANAIKLLAVTKGGVYDLNSARVSLIAALGDKRDEVRIASAEALAQFDKPDAQQAVADLANGAEPPENVRIAAYAAASESVRQFGSSLTDKQAQDVIAVVESGGSLPLREGAAQLLGALNLPSEKIKSLIVNAK